MSPYYEIINTDGMEFPCKRAASREHEALVERIKVLPEGAKIGVKIAPEVPAKKVSSLQGFLYVHFRNQLNITYDEKNRILHIRKRLPKEKKPVAQQ